MTPVGMLFKQSASARLTASLGLAAMLLVPGLVYRSGPAGEIAGTIVRRDSTIGALFSGTLPPPPAEVTTTAALDTSFAKEGYTLEAVRQDAVAVPRLFLARLPADLKSLDSVALRKELFVKMLLPLVLAENERILTERTEVLRLRARVRGGQDLSGVDQQWLVAVADRYDLDYDPDTDDPSDLLEELALRVDAVPPSLAFGQAALETGWGTSHPAQNGRAMFGQMVFYGDGDKAGSAVRRFDHLAHAVEAYALNLNTHRAYARFRGKRATMRAQDLTPDGYELALTLGSYSERKMSYVRDVRGIIKANHLRPLDQARLG